ncbi:MAG: LLM class F420-dependent oxidoreductase [Anaerolineae bacterium]|nr:LLM class F420-dependent oxidoreductase [Anaerolineae bacterium]
MQLGVIFPQTEMGPDAGAVRAYATGIESLGYTHLQVYDHVLGADTRERPDWRGAYRLEDQFHEVMVLFGYLAAVTQRVELVTGVLVLPQRQTALVAKQAAEVDLLSGGRLRLGVGIGWNAVEYEALGENFHNRGRRIEEQIAVLRHLWTTPSVHFTGRWHVLPDAGLNPLPVQRPIPVWMGGTAEPVLERVGRLADGWFPQWRAFPSVEGMRAAIGRVRAAAEAAGRDPHRIGISGVMTMSQGTPDDWLRAAQDWQAAGASYLAVNTMGARLPSPDGHLAALKRFMDEVAPAL